MGPGDDFVNYAIDFAQPITVLNSEVVTNSDIKIRPIKVCQKSVIFRLNECWREEYSHEISQVSTYYEKMKNNQITSKDYYAKIYIKLDGSRTMFYLRPETLFFFVSILSGAYTAAKGYGFLLSNYFLKL